MRAQDATQRIEPPAPHEKVESNMIDGDLTNTWLRRARAENGADADLGAESISAAQALAVRSRDGWDPWEVWLRHIDQPRRRHTAGRKSPD